MRTVCDDFETELIELNGERDHIHLHVHYPPKVSISTLVGSLKGVSARRLRQEYPDHIHKYLSGTHFWSPSYFQRAAAKHRRPPSRTTSINRNARRDLHVRATQRSEFSLV